ncbi:FecR domain-containing protein [Xanthobacter agilis]|uniref:FecR protein domain-containing protein n=1 Tax=Xanthobacter agilis TaxID=47492 RepID=A0ABU0LHM4_XANAG|nr:FecR domain-containing protein [Xanthobacter agilis]MDQ0506646.1 hypothetical protein [Xanthobacter agilis]
MKADVKYRDRLKGVSRRVALLAVMVVALAMPQELYAQDPIATLAATGRPGIGTLEVVSGTVTLERDGKAGPATTGDAVTVGDTILTDDKGRAVLSLGASTQVSIGSDTRFRVDHFAPGEDGAFTLGEGAMLYTRSARGQQPPVSFAAPFGAVEGRAGRFFIGRVEGQYGVAVMRGRVKVVVGGGAVNLEPGDAADIPRNGSAPTAAQPWSEARLRLALSLVE